MAFPSTVRGNSLAIGVVGDIVLSGAVRSQPVILKTTNAANNVIGRACTHVADNDGEAVVGGSGAFAGILTNAKQYAKEGIGASNVLPNNVPVQATTMASGIVVALTGTAAIGNAVFYSTTDGSLSAAASGATVSGSVEIPNSKVVRMNVTAAGLAIIELTD